MKKSVVSGLVALAVAGLTSPALGASPSQFDNSRVSVSFADLNIHKEAGARVLYKRLQRASAKVCDMNPHRKFESLASRFDAEQCYNETLDKSVAKIDSEALRKLHSS